MALTTPTRSDSEVRQHAIFRALMWALSYPGRAQRMPAGGLAAFAAIGEALLDLETGFFTPHAELRARLAATGARALAPDTAPYQFFPMPDASDATSPHTAYGRSALRPSDAGNDPWSLIELLALAPIGSYREPDTAATIVVGCRFGEGADTGIHGAGASHHGPHPLSPSPAAQERGDAPQPGLVRLTLRGPGINPSALSPQPSALTLQLAGLPPDLWRLRAERGLYPLGWDMVLVDDDRVVGLPRTTQVEVL